MYFKISLLEIILGLINWKSRWKFLTFLILLICLLSCKASERDKKPEDPLNIVGQIADRFIAETDFSFELTYQPETHNLQVIDFRKIYLHADQAEAYALSFIESEKDTDILFGFSYCQSASIWVNDQLIFTGREKSGYKFREYTYDRFYFDEVLKIPLRPGSNKIIVKVESESNEWLFMLRPVNELGDEEPSISFGIKEFTPLIDDHKWLVLGPFIGDNTQPTVFPPEKSLEEKYLYNGKWYTWQVPERNLILGLKMNPDQVFNREPYADWHYGIGTTLMSVLNLADETSEVRYNKFVEQYADFVIENLDYFSWQYYEYHAIRESFHRLIRRSMLDDCGAPSYPVLELYIREKNEEYRFLIDTLANFIANGQSRLEDSTLCRPEPLRWTIWADDLFMSVPFMLRMARITGDSSWYDDVVHQVIQFNKYLYDNRTGLYKHGWFSQSGETSEVFWCRANGWMAWAIAEALLWLPEDYPGYESILNIFKTHMENLAKYQDITGLWHQVLDHPESYLETSGSAMYMLTMARGVNHGWLDKKFADTAIRGWEGISERITSDGIVSGICRGTPIGNSLEFYNNRETFDNDPRGLGAVIQAGIELHKLMEKQNYTINK